MDTPIPTPQIPETEHREREKTEPFDFFQYAVDRGLLSRTDAVSLRKSVATERIPLGQILMFHGQLSVRQVMHVLAIQADSPQLRFGEIAVREGFIDTLQLQAALERQQVMRLHPIEALRRSGLISFAELDSMMLDYVRFLEMHLSHYESKLQLA